jgi:hypothetical protein
MRALLVAGVLWTSAGLGPAGLAGPASGGEASGAAACAPFLPEDRAACRERVAAHRAAVARLEARRVEAGPVERCRIVCDLREQDWRLRQATREWTVRVLHAAEDAARSRRAGERDRLERRRDALLAERRARRAGPDGGAAPGAAPVSARLEALDAELARVAGRLAALERSEVAPRATEEALDHLWVHHCDEIEARSWLEACRRACERGEPAPPPRDCLL